MSRATSLLLLLLGLGIPSSGVISGALSVLSVALTEDAQEGGVEPLGGGEEIDEGGHWDPFG